MSRIQTQGNAGLQSRARSQEGRLARWRRTRWPFLLGLIPPGAAVAVTIAAPSPDGHWTEHLAGAAQDFAAVVVLLAAAWLTRRHLGWTILFVPVVAAGMVAAGWGDATVARSIWRVAGDHTQSFQANDPAAYGRGHDLDALGGMIMLAAGVVFVGAVGVTRRVKYSAAIFGGVLALAPPWLLGGFGAWWVMARVHSEQLRGQQRLHAGVAGSGYER